MTVHIVGGKFLGYDNMPTIWTLQENPNNAFLGELTVMLKRFNLKGHTSGLKQGSKVTTE